MGRRHFGPLLMRRSTCLESTVRSMLVVLFLCSVCYGAAVAADTEGSALLELKKSLSDPTGLLSGWVLDSSGKGCCSWFGVTCDRNSRVVSINVSGGVGNGAETPFLCSDSAQFPVYYHGIRRSCVGSDGKLVGTLSPAIANLSELRILALPFQGLYGGLPSEIWGMEKLEMIDLEGNSMGGSVPGQIGGLKNLRVLNLGFNKISGEIPSSLSSLGSLEVLNLAGNSLNGSVPGFVGQLRAVHLSFNQFIGSIPSEIGKNCGKLEHLDLSGNFLGGRIPSSIGDCSWLRSLLVYSNMLEEEIPAELGRLMSLEVLDLSRNTLSGPVPSELGSCTNLSIIVLSNTLNPTQPRNTTGDVILSKFYTMGDEYNYFQGKIPAEITILPKLRILWSPRANLEGNIPEMWGSCESLEVVNLAQNLLLGKVPPQFNRCKNLRFLDLSSNRLYGEISGVMNIPCMTLFKISGNALSGQLPRINGSSCLSSRRLDGNIDSPAVYLSSYAYGVQGDYLSGPLSLDKAVVVYHDFSQNNFSGFLDSLPMVSERMGDRTLYVFSAKGNDLSGPFPPNLLMNCDAAWDGILINVSRNRLSGPIPSWSGSSCKSLIAFDASENQLSGTIPSSLGELNSVVVLDLSWNSLQGPIPASFGNMRALKSLLLAGNRLNGSIPHTLGLLRYLEVLDLSSNSFSGGIPNDIVMLRCLKVLLLDNNDLSGHLPSNLKNATALVALNVSLNNLSGPLPLYDSFLSCDDFLGNNFSQPCSSFYLGVPSANLQRAKSQNYAAPLVGSQNHGRSFNSIKIALIASASAIVSVLLTLIVLCVYTRRMRWNTNLGPVRKELTIFNNIGIPLEFEDVVRATGGFNASNCIGNGGFGATYKAEVAPDVLVAVKRLAVGRFQGIQQLNAEIKTLGQLKHENLVTLIGYHASETEMFLIYNYLPGGNLERFIQERSNQPMDWRVLHKIALHVASALNYLHSKCVPRVLHRDVKPSNILLDNNHNAYLSDFGLARLLGTSETHATTGVAGTFGYVAPEYAMTCRVSDKADVYSYGVVLLELLSDKKALDPSFSSYGNGFNIVQWACMLLRQGRAKEFFVAGLWDISPHDDLIKVLHLAVVCTVDSLSTRPTMKLVLHRLRQLQPPASSNQAVLPCGHEFFRTPNVFRSSHDVVRLATASLRFDGIPRERDRDVPNLQQLAWRQSGEIHTRKIESARGLEGTPQDRP